MVKIRRTRRLIAQRPVIEKRLADVVAKAGFDLEAAVKMSMVGSKSGRVYEHEWRMIGGRPVQIGLRRPAHQASAPGEPPARDTGALFNSYRFRMTGPFRGVMGSSSETALHTEFGTRHMAPRPHVAPAVSQIRPAFVEAVRRVIG